MNVFVRRAAVSSLLLANMLLVSAAPAQSAVVASPKQSTTKINHNLDADLRAAVGAKNVKQVRKLLKRGADPNTKDTDSYATPMLGKVAGEGDNLEIAQALVEAGANLEAGNSQGASPLTLSTLDGHLEIAKYLLQHGANIEANGFAGLTPLMCAASAGETETVRFLISAVASVTRARLITARR